MPTEIDIKKIGSLFGGEIMSLNYNFQAGSESSTCTLTLVSENNTFSIPKMNEVVSLPPFGIQMAVLETRIRQDPLYSVLQVELIDSMSEILDKELVLTYGTHTDLRGELSAGVYEIEKELFAPRSAYPPTTLFNNNVTFPATSKKFRKNYGDGKNAIGFGRLTLKKKVEKIITVEDINDINITRGIEDQTTVVFDGLELNRDLTDDQVILADEGLTMLKYSFDNSSLSFGYTLSNLIELIKSKGISLEGFENLNEDNVLFSDSGTIRSVLTSVLSKIGRSFYVDPITQKIHIITNADISSINQNLDKLYSNFENTEAAEQLSLSKSIKNVQSTATIVKGNASLFKPDQANQGEQGPPRLFKQRLYKLDTERITKTLLNAQDIFLIERVAPFFQLTKDRLLTDNYIFALAGVSNGTDRWGDLYGEKQYNYEGVIPRFDPTSGDEQAWYEDMVKDRSAFNFKDFNEETSDQAIRLVATKKKGEKENRNAISASQDGYLELVDNFITLWGGVYFSNPASFDRMDRRLYTEKVYSGDRTQPYTFAQYDAEESITNVDELSFLVNLIRRYAQKTGIRAKNLKVKEVAALTAAPQGGKGGGRYVIAVRNMNFFSDGIIQDVDFREQIENNYYQFDNSVGDNYLALSPEGFRPAKFVADACNRAFDKQRELTKKSIITKYQIVTDSDNDRGDQKGRPELNFIDHIPSKVKNFSKKALNVFSSDYTETRAFIENINSFSPEFEGPFVTTDIKYYRPPKRDDFQIKNGVDSIAVSMSEQGVTTSVKYSSRKFAKIDSSLTKHDLNGLSASPFRENSSNAFTKNQQSN
tara:strand:+ start:4916 stop:7372 length:2457 start_codon:yes stop_codon:yes gene_type:complete